MSAVKILLFIASICWFPFVLNRQDKQNFIMWNWYNVI